MTFGNQHTRMHKKKKKTKKPTYMENVENVENKKNETEKKSVLLREFYYNKL